MKINFIQKLAGKPWDISRDRARTILASMIQRLRAERPAEDLCGEKLPKMEIIGDTAFIPIHGTLILNAPKWAKEWGLSITDPNDIAEELRQAVDDSRVRAIVLDFDSPGGESVAGDKLFDLVDAATARMGSKPILAWCADGALLCSAAFNGALPSHRIITGPYACVGSVGSYLAVLDDSEFWKMMGFALEVFRSGEIKGIGEDALSDEQRAFLQDMVDRSGASFRGHVARYRTIPPENLRGQWYDGKDALPLGFVDETAPDLPTALARFHARF